MMAMKITYEVVAIDCDTTLWSSYVSKRLALTTCRRLNARALLNGLTKWKVYKVTRIEITR